MSDFEIVVFEPIRMNEVTQILSRIDAGDQLATQELLPIVYNELRQVAASQMAGERSDHTLQPTALVHEAYLRLIDPNDQQAWASRAHFFAAAVEAMRRILIDRARRKHGIRHGGSMKRIDLDGADPVSPSGEVDVIALDEALEQLAAVHPDKARLVQLRFFAGLTVEEAANVIGVSVPTAVRMWRHARAWLAGRLSETA